VIKVGDWVVPNVKYCREVLLKNNCNGPIKVVDRLPDWPHSDVSPLPMVPYFDKELERWGMFCVCDDCNGTFSDFIKVKSPITRETVYGKLP
jgi:hypothetical protein